MGEHLSRLWVTLQCLSRSGHWREGVNTHPDCESLSSVWPDQNHWQERVNTHPVCESLSRVWADQNHWQEPVDIHSASESLSHVWVVLCRPGLKAASRPCRAAASRAVSKPQLRLFQAYSSGFSIGKPWAWAQAPALGGWIVSNLCLAITVQSVYVT